MNRAVKLIRNEDGETGEALDGYWHFATVFGSSNTLLCTGEFYGFGEGYALVKEKETKRGGVTCPACLSMIREIKAYRL